MKYSFYLLLALAIVTLPVVSLFAHEGFVENKGQIINQNRLPNSSVLFLHNNHGLNIQLRKAGFSYDIWQQTNKENTNSEDATTITTFHRVDIEFLNANREIAIVANQPAPSYDNFYTEYSGQEGIKQVRSYSSVLYKNVWESIDIVFISNNKKVKYNFIIHPGGDINDIQLSVNGANNVSVSNGRLLLETAITTIEETVPYSYITNNEQKNTITAEFTQLNYNTIGITISEPVPANATTVIDPVPDFLWGTYHGSGGTDVGEDGAVDIYNNIYIAGYTNSTTVMATNGAFQNTFAGDQDAFIQKYSATGAKLWGTYYGGNSEDKALGLVTDKSGHNIFITGLTSSANTFSTTNAQQAVLGGLIDGFVCKFDSAGNRIWSTYYGGAAQDYFDKAAIDVNNNLYIGGTTASSTGITTPNSFKPVFSANYHGLLAKFDSSGNRIWATYYGNNASTELFVAAVANDTIYVAGTTDAISGISTPGSYQPARGGGKDACLVLFDTAGNRLSGTYFGGISIDYGYSAKLDNDNNIYLCGSTESQSNIATTNAHQTTYGSSPPYHGDGFLVKFTKGLQGSWATYYGGSKDERVLDIAIDRFNDVYITGDTRSTNNISTPGTAKPNFTSPTNHMFIAKFSANGVRYWGTYYGLYSAAAYTMQFDNNQDLMLFGATQGAFLNFNGPQPAGGGFADAFVIKLKGCHAGFATANSNSPVHKGSTIALDASGGVSYAWQHPGGFSSALKNPVINNAQAKDSGIYTVIVTDSAACRDTARVSVTILDTTNSVRDIAGNSTYKLYPNPAHNELILEMADNKPAYITIYNIVGKEMLKSKPVVINNVVRIALNDILAGIYTYTISCDNRITGAGKLQIE